MALAWRTYGNERNLGYSFCGLRRSRIGQSTALLAGGLEFDLCSVMKQTTQVASVLRRVVRLLCDQSVAYGT